jgi:peptidoglycan/LPS O-acetylase OafA/YrhL
MAANALPAVVDNQSDGATASGHRAIPGGRRPDLQGMRAVAVLAVFSNHLFNWPSGGFVGVDVFFVLSGFFITGLLIRKRTSTGKLSFRHFYIRRVKRIVPSAVLVLTATVIGSYLLFPAIRARETLVDALYASVFAANYHDVATGADYFQKGQPPSPLLHFWSLSIEEQFYFVWPASLVVIFGLTGRFWSGNARGQQCGLFGATALVVVGSFLWALCFPQTTRTARTSRRSLAGGNWGSARWWRLPDRGSHASHLPSDLGSRMAGSQVLCCRCL